MAERQTEARPDRLILSAQERQALACRMGEELFEKRLFLEENREKRLGGLVRWCPMKYAGPAANFVFHATGQWKRAHREFLDIQVREEEFVIPGLAKELDGFTILHVSDLHLDVSADLAPAFRAALGRVAGRYDLACATGDFNNFTVHDDLVALNIVASLRDAFTSPVLGCLGNHDSVRDVPTLERAGYKMLVNESVRVRKRDAAPDAPSLFVAGVDDPNIFGTHDLAAALAGRRAGEPVVLLAHAPSIHLEAAASGVSLVLCGHVHGGQICLKSGKTLAWKHWRFPRSVWRGRWTEGATQGYTTTGVGACGAPLRLNCPPEIVLVRLATPR